MKYVFSVLALLGASACADEAPTYSVAQIEALGRIDFVSTTGPQRIVTEINGCFVTIDTLATAGERNGQIDHRDEFLLTQVTFVNDGASPRNYGVPFLQGIEITDDTPITVSYTADVPDAITRTVPTWKDVRQPYQDGPTWDGVEYVIGARQRGSFILDGLEGQRAANAFISALVAYREANCSGTS
jgi:hypothetical protein